MKCDTIQQLVAPVEGGTCCRRPSSTARPEPVPGQIPLTAGLYAAGPSGLREMTARERLDTELDPLTLGGHRVR